MTAWPLLCRITALLALTAPGLAQAELGRLFHTPEKRALLDRARQLQLAESDVERPPAITIDGVIKTPRGATVWVNGQPQMPRSHAAGMRIDGCDDATCALLTPIDPGSPSRKTQPVKAGETLKRDTPKK